MDPFEQDLPVGKDEHPHGDPEVIPEISLAAGLHPARLIKTVGQFEDLVHGEGEEVQKEEVEGKVLFPQRPILTSSSAFFSSMGKSVTQALW
jgi:hypothetical protein